MGEQKKYSVSFSGCGFQGFYHLGVAGCMREYAPYLLDKITGTSAGSMVATAVVAGCSLGDCVSTAFKVALDARKHTLGPLHPSFQVTKIIAEGFRDVLPPDAYKKCSGKLFISLTRLKDRKNFLISEFESNDDMIQAVICSSFIPMYCGFLPPLFRGDWFIDGGLTDNNPILDENTITVSPFAGESDICPSSETVNPMQMNFAGTSIQLCWSNLNRLSAAFYPPSPESLSKCCQQGFEDCLAFLQKNDLMGCTRHLSVYSSITTVSEDKPSYRHTNEEVDSADTGSESSGFNSDLDSCDEDEEIDCPACSSSRRKTADLKKLPPSVVHTIQHYTELANKGLLTPIYNMHAFKALVLMCTPMVLPFDITVVVLQRLCKWMPYLSNDLQQLVKEVQTVIQDIVNYIQHRRHRFSARFTCQLAITETDFFQDEGPLQVLSSRATSTESLDSTHLEHRYHHKHVKQMGFSVDLKTHHRSPLKRVNEMRHHIVEEEKHGGHVDLHEIPPSEELVKSRASSLYNLDNLPVTATQAEFDTFDNCLHIADQMESVLAYYYTSEDDPNVVKVTEIFALNDPRSPTPKYKTADLSWDHQADIHHPHQSSSLEGVTDISEIMDSSSDLLPNSSDSSILPNSDLSWDNLGDIDSRLETSAELSSVC